MGIGSTARAWSSRFDSGTRAFGRQNLVGVGVREPSRERRWHTEPAPGHNKHSLRYWRGDRQQPVAYEYIAPARAHTEKEG